MKDIIRRVLKEDVNNTLYDKIIKVMRRPYVDFLRKNGLGDKKTVTEIMKRKFGDGHISYQSEDEWDFDVIEYRFTWSNNNKGFYEERKKRGDGNVNWTHMEKIINGVYTNNGNDFISKRKHINSDGDKEYYEVDSKTGRTVHEYESDDDWDNVPIEIRNDKFFSNNY